MLNNPYVPGDPYSYDLKWLVAKVKEILTQLGTLDEAIEAKIFEGFLEHSIVQFKTVPEMLAADITDGSIVLTLGYHEAGDLGGIFYLVKDFNPSQCALNYFLTLDNNKQIAIPIIVTPYVTPEMFGAYGDATANDNSALHAAAEYAENNGVTLKLAKSYLYNETLTMFDGFDIDCTGSLIYSGTGVGVYLGAAGEQDMPPFGQHILRLNVSRPSLAWNDGSIGIKVVNVREAELHVSVSRFDIGLQMVGDGWDCTYNTIYINTLYNNRVAIDITNTTGGACNQNTFIGGRIGASGSSEPLLGSSNYYALRAIPTGSATLNNNVFLNCSFEYGGDKTRAYVRVDATYNMLISCRYENIQHLDFTGSQYTTIFGGTGFETSPTITLPRDCTIYKGGQSVKIGLTGPDGLILQGSGNNTSMLQVYSAANAKTIDMSALGDIDAENSGGTTRFGHIHLLRPVANDQQMKDMASGFTGSNQAYISTRTDNNGFVLGFRANANYEIQVNLTVNGMFVRYKYAGTWQDWKTIQAQ